MDCSLSTPIRTLWIPPDRVDTVRQIYLKRGLVEDHLVDPSARATRGLVLEQPIQMGEPRAALPTSPPVAERAASRQTATRPPWRRAQMSVAPAVATITTIEEVVLW